MDEKVVWSAGGVIIENNKALICYRKRKFILLTKRYSRKK